MYLYDSTHSKQVQKKIENVFDGMSYMGGVITIIPVSKIFLQTFLLVWFSSKTTSLDCKVKDRTKINKNMRGVLQYEFLHISFISKFDPKHFSFLSLGPNMRFFISQGVAFSDADRPRLGEAPICGWL